MVRVKMKEKFVLICLLFLLGLGLLSGIMPQHSFIPKVNAASPYLPVSGDAWTENSNASYPWIAQATTKDTISFSTEKVKVGSYSFKVNHTYAATQMAFSLDVGASTDFSSYAFMSMWVYLQRTTAPTDSLDVDWRTTARFSGNKYEFLTYVDVNRWQKIAVPLTAWLNSTAPVWTNRRYLCIQLMGLTATDYSTLYVDGIRFETSWDYYSETNSVDETILPNLWAFVKNNQKVATKSGVNYQSTYTYTALNDSHQYETLESESLGFTIYALVWAYNYSGQPFLLDEAEAYANWLLQFQHSTTKGFSQWYNNATGNFDNIASATYNGWILSGLSFLYSKTSNATLKTALDSASNFWASTMWDSANKWFDKSYNMATSTKTDELTWEDMPQGIMMCGMWSYYKWVNQNATILGIMNTHSNKGYAQNALNRYAFATSVGEDTVYMDYGFYSAYLATSNATYKERLFRLQNLVLANNMLNQNATMYQCVMLSDLKGTYGFEGWGWGISLPLLLGMYEIQSNANLINYVEMALWNLLPQIKTSYAEMAFTRYRGSTGDMATQQQVVGENAFLYAAISFYYAKIYKPTNPYLISTTRNVTSTDYSNEQLAFTVSASSGQTSTTKIYCGTKGKPTSVFIDGVAKLENDGWSFSSSVATVSVSGTRAVVLDWSSEYSPPQTVLQQHYRLTVTVYNDLGTLQINARVQVMANKTLIASKMTDRNNQAAFSSLNKGSYTILVESDCGIALKVLYLDMNQELRLRITQTSQPTSLDGQEHKIVEVIEIVDGLTRWAMTNPLLLLFILMSLVSTIIVACGIRYGWFDFD